MQKKLIALAVAGLVSGAAFAQSNVTIYGAMDSTWENIKAAGATASGADLSARGRLASNSSHIGFKGAESLGNGLTAVFQFEVGTQSDTGGWNTSSGWSGGNRDTLIGIAGGFGTVAVGNLTHPARLFGAKVDFNPGASSAGFTGSMYGEVAGLKTGIDDRAQNAVAWISPTVGGVHGVLAMVNGSPATGDGKAAMKDAKTWTAAVAYDAGGLFLGLSYLNAKNPGVASAVAGALVSPATGTAVAGINDKLTDTRLAARYDMPTGTSFSALWDAQKYEIAGVTTAKRTAYMIGANQSFGASNVWLQYAQAKDLTDKICDLVSCGDTGAKQWTLGYSYSLSKRTMLHAFYTKITNDKGVAYDAYVNSIGAAAGADPQSYGIGMRHTF